MATLDYKQGRNLDAIEKLNFALKINPNFALAYFNRGNAYMELEEYPQAIIEFKSSILLNPNFEESYINLAKAYFYINYYQEALAVLDEVKSKTGALRAASSLSNDITEVYANDLLSKGLDYFAISDFDRAITNIKQAISIKPDLKQAYYKLGHIYFLINDFSEANKYLSKSIALNPKNINAFKMLGEIKYQQGEYEKAISYFKKATSLNPRDAEIYNNLSFSYYKIDQYDVAITYIKKAVELEPANIIFRFSLANILRDAGYYDRALGEYLYLTNKKNDLTGLHLEIAGVYFSKGQIEKANRELEEEIKQRIIFLSKNPKDLESLYILAEAYEMKSEYNKAIEVYKDILSINPNMQNDLLNKIQSLEKNNTTN